MHKLVKKGIICQNCGETFQAVRNDAKRCPKCLSSGMHYKGASNICPDCGGYKYGNSQRCHSCENKNKWLNKRGQNNPNWHGGRSKSGEGHIVVLKPEGYAPELKHRYVLEHRLIWEQAHGKLLKGYIIHHLNGVKDDNRLENLAALPRSAHSGSAVLNVFKQRIRQLEAQLKEFQTQNHF